MAAQNDRRALGAGAAASAAPGGILSLGVIGIVLGLALLAVAVVQARQFNLLKETMRFGDDNVALTVYRTETEYLRLREQWARAVDERQPLDLPALQLRYDVWVSRVDLIRDKAASGLMPEQSDFDGLVRQLDDFVAAADRLLGPQPSAVPDRPALVALQPALEALGRGIQDVALAATHQAAAERSERDEAVRRHNQVGIGLTLFLSALTLAFAMVALRQLRKAEARGRALEELTAHLQTARREAETASAAKSTFLANMSHEIRTPFQGLMGMLSLLRETGLTARQVDYLRTATESADHLLAILNDILDMSQLESGRMKLTPAPIDLRALLRDVEALMRPQANTKSLALHIGADPGVPERVMADATRVKQILFNLLSNAIKFSERGAISLDVRQGAMPDGSAAIEFLVSDTGIGMDADTLAGLFRRFAPGDSSRSRRHPGAGLGLEISRNLARLMGGDITATSHPGQGSRFVFRAPLPAVTTLPALAAAETVQPRLPEHSLRVLVAEDHPVNRQYMAALLESLGHRAHFAANGLEAVQAVREQPFDIVLMDLHMPELDGIGATRAIRALPDRQAATLPIVALTADAFPETRERCLVAGMNDFLTKPVGPDKLGTALRRLFGAAATEASAGDALRQPPPVSADGSPPLIDPVAVATALQAMSRERLGAMIHDFLDEGPQTVQRLRAAMRDAQALELRVNAHAARGAALNLGLAALAATAEALHEGSSHLPAHEIAHLVQRFDDLLPRTRAAALAAGLRPATTLATR